MRNNLKLKKGPDYTFPNLIKKIKEAREKEQKKEKKNEKV